MKKYLNNMENPEGKEPVEEQKSDSVQSSINNLGIIITIKYLAEPFQPINQRNSLFELSSKRKLTRMRANNPILNQEDKQDEIYSIQKAVTQLGGISDTLAPLHQSLVNNEIANIKNRVKYISLSLTSFIGKVILLAQISP